jgi:hypothetical protein
VQFSKKLQPASSKVDIPLDELLEAANSAFSAGGYTLWVVFDRLDVAFNDNPDLEKNALRALFRAYNNLKRYDNINLKIFVRDDIWERISEGGFPEASHITRTTTIDWSYDNLVNLFVRRLLNNQSIVDYLKCDVQSVVEDFESQLSILQRIFPDKVETGNNPETFRWMTNRIPDASGKSAPRELIHLSECIRREQIARLERGVFKPGLKVVSRVRYDQTFVAENLSLKPFTDKLKGQKAEQSHQTLSEIWGVSPSESLQWADRLLKAGFFEARETLGVKSYWVPFIYRDALELVQGKAYE